MNLGSLPVSNAVLVDNGFVAIRSPWVNVDAVWINYAAGKLYLRGEHITWESPVSRQDRICDTPHYYKWHYDYFMDEAFDSVLRSL